MKTAERESELKTVDDFIEFFSGIPEEQWCCESFKNPDGRCCAAGHLGEDAFTETKNGSNLERLMGDWGTVWSINDGDHPDFQQPTPRARILAALNEIKAKQEKQ